jgi:hypothetical protein
VLYVHLANERKTHRRFVCVFVSHRDATANEQDVQLTRAGVDIGSVWKSVDWHLNGIFTERNRQFITLRLQMSSFLLYARQHESLKFIF